MATTRIIPMHVNRGKTIAQCLTDRTSYAKNPDKTDDGELVSAFACDPRTADAEFLFSKRQYKTITGREQTNDVIAYQVRQSFKPGEITPVEANRIGFEFATRFLKGNHAFIVATHIDRKHIHNHIIWNSTALDYTRKFRNFWNSTQAVSRLSDMLCTEHLLSVVEHPSPKGKHYGKWLGDQTVPSHRELLRFVIDEALSQKPDDFEALLKLVSDVGFEIKRGKNIALRGKEQKRFIRLDSLGNDYSEDALRAVLTGAKTHKPRKKNIQTATPEFNLLVDIQAKLQAGKGSSYERWAKVFNLKQMALTVNYLTEHGLLEYAQLSEKTTATTARYNELSVRIKAAETRMAEIGNLKAHIVNYSKTREVYTAYRKAGYSKKFYEAHASDILLHKAAKVVFDALPGKKIPTLKTLQAEYKTLLAEKKKAYETFVKVREEMKEILTAKANVDRLLGKENDKVPVHGQLNL